MLAAGAGAGGAGGGPASDVEVLHRALKSLARVRELTGKLWKNVADGASIQHGDEGREKRFMTDVKALVDDVNKEINQLDQTLNSTTIVGTHLPLGQSLYLSLDATAETMPLYNGLANSYKWMDKAHAVASISAQVLSVNNLNRSQGRMTKNRRKPPGSNQLLGSCRQLEEVINGLSRSFPNMQFKMSRPNDSKLNAVVEITLERVLRATIIFKGMIIEWVFIRGFGEDTSLQGNGRVSDGAELWRESKYKVFRRITENANAAILHYHYPTFPDVAVKTFIVRMINYSTRIGFLKNFETALRNSDQSETLRALSEGSYLVLSTKILFQTYIHCFKNIFTDHCKKCGLHLHNNLPPTWREFKTLEPYHEDCRP